MQLCCKPVHSVGAQCWCTQRRPVGVQGEQGLSRVACLIQEEEGLSRVGVQGDEGVSQGWLASAMYYEGQDCRGWRGG